MKKYLENSICNFTPLFKIDYTIKKNIIACCFFKRYNSYYKDFSKYIDGLQALYNTVLKFYKDFSIRLFIDNSIFKDKDIMSKLNKLNKLEMVLYDCPIFKKDDIHHIGLFGTLIRFFPMFNFPNNDAKIVILSDIDDHAFKKYIELFKILGPRMDDLYLIKFSNAGRMFKNKEVSNQVYKNIILDYIKPQEMVCLKQVDYDIIINFLKKLSFDVYLNIKYSSYINDNLVKNDNYISKYENNGYFIYGIDEYFLNNVYIKYIVSHKIPFVERLNFNIFNIYYYQMLARNEEWLDKEKIIYELLLDKILKYLKIKSNDNLKNKFDLILKLIEKNDEKSIDIKYKLYELFIKNKNRKKYKFLFNTFYNDLLLYKYIGIYEFSELKFYYINFKNFFEKKKSFDDEKIKNLVNLAYKKENNTDIINLNNKPDFLIIGVQNAGIKQFAFNIELHKDIFVYDDEIHFFDKKENCDNNTCDIEKYYKYFISMKKFKGDRTTDYILIRNCIDNIQKYLPNVKLIILLREPIQRLIIQYNIKIRQGVPKQTLMEEINKDKDVKLEDITDSGSYLLQRGYYIDQIEYVLSKFPKENVYIGIVEEFANNPDKYNEIIKFIGAKPTEKFKPKVNLFPYNYKIQLTTEELDYLYKIYKPYNERLYKFLGREIKLWNIY